MTKHPLRVTTSVRRFVRSETGRVAWAELVHRLAAVSRASATFVPPLLGLVTSMVELLTWEQPLLTLTVRARLIIYDIYAYTCL